MPTSYLSGKTKKEKNRQMSLLGSAWFLLLSPLNFSGADLSQQIPPPRFPLSEAPPATLNSAPASSVALGDLVIVFDETTLAEAQKQIKLGRIDNRGDASESSFWLCYSISGSGSQEQIWLLSHGGGDDVIDGVAARISSTPVTANSCPELPAAFQPVRLNNKIWLRSPATEIRKQFGKPSLQRGAWLHYESERELLNDPRAKGWGADTLYEYGELSVRIRAGKVIELWATVLVSD